jgi:Ser/Thr protein kinase RdoA (MazF antagonist)
VTAIDPALLADLQVRLAETIEFRLAEIRPLTGAAIATNRLLHLRAEDGREAVAKIYYRGDKRRRLEREYAALALLKECAVARVPVPLLRDDERYYAVYSLAPGTPAAAAEFTPAYGADLAHFAADLHRLRRGEGDHPLPTARGALNALADRAGAIMRAYLEPHRALVASADAPPAVRALYAELDAAGEVDGLLAAIVADLGPVWHAALTPEELRLTTGDAGPHNVLLQVDGRVAIVDLESAGWDHPLAFVTDFLTHDQSLDLPPGVAEAFVETYRAESSLSDALYAELDRACALRHVFWCAIHLTAASPERLARRRFSDPGADLDVFLAEQFAKLRRRLAIAREAVSRLV